MKRIIWSIITIVFICGARSAISAVHEGYVDELRIPVANTNSVYISIPNNNDWNVVDRNFTMDYWVIKKPLTPAVNICYNVAVMRHGNGIQAFVRDVQIRVAQ